MKVRKLKKTVIPALYASVAVLFVGSIFLTESLISKNYKEKEKDYDYVSETIFDHTEPVVNTEVVMIKPYSDPEVKILKSFYDYQGSEEEQENSILEHEDTYLQNTGVIYGGKDGFDIVSVLDGEITDIKEDPLLGIVIEVRHTPEITCVYESLSAITVKKGDHVSLGQVLGKSGTSEINKKLGSHLLFEMILRGQNVNPENYYNKKVNEI